MPRTRFDAKSKKADKLVVLIWGTMVAKEISPSELAGAIGISHATLCRRKENPEDFTLKEICKIGRYLVIPLDELRQCIGPY